MVLYDDENGGGPLLLRSRTSTVGEMAGDGSGIFMLESSFGTR